MKHPSHATRLRKNIRLAAAALWLATFGSAHASQDPSDPPPGPEVLQLSPFEVTSSRDEGYRATNTIGATKTDTPIQNLPMTIDVVTDDFIRDIGALNFADALAYQTGVNVPQNANNNLQARIRGLPSQFYLRDGVIAYREPSAASIDRIEVIRGAAGIVYGESEPGGVINVITKKAELSGDFGRLGATVDSFGSVTGDFDANVVNGDKTLAFRFAGSDATERFRFESMTGRSYTFLPSVRWKPAKKTEILVQLISSKDEIRNFDPGVVIPGLRDTTILRDSGGNPYQYSNNLSNPLARLIESTKNYGVNLSTFFPAYVAAGGTQSREQLLGQLNRFAGDTTPSPSGMDPAQAADPFGMNPFKDSGLTENYNRTDLHASLNQSIVENGAGLVESLGLRLSYNRIADVMKQDLPIADYHNGNLRGVGLSAPDGSGQSFGPSFIQSPSNPFRGTNRVFYGFEYLDLGNTNDVFNVDSSTKLNLGEAGTLNLLLGCEHAIQRYYSPQDSTGDHWQGVENNATYSDAAGGNLVGAGYAGWGVYDLDTHQGIPPQSLPARLPASETTQHLTQRSTEDALYSTAQWKLFGDTLEILGALRTSSIQRRDARYDAVPGGNPTSYHPLNPQYGLLWNVTPTVSLYASRSQSFQYESNHDADAFGNVQPPTKGSGYETGMKSSWFGGRLSADLSLFDLQLSGLPYKDPFFQEVYLPTGSTASDWSRLGSQYLVNPDNPNGAKAVLGLERFGEEMDSKGADFQMFYYPFAGWEGIFNVSYSKVKIFKSLPILNGSEILDDPKLTASLWDIYKFSGRLRGFEFGVGTRFIEGYQTSWAFSTKNAYLWDAMAAYRWKVRGNHSWSVQLNAKNLTNKLTYSVDSFPSETSFTSQNPTINGQGREYELSVHYEF